MLKNPSLTKRYAKGLFEATKGTIDLARLEAGLIGKEKELSRPRMTVNELIKLCGFEPPRPVRALLAILIRRKRQKLLPEIAEAYRIISEEMQGIKRAEVTTAVPLNSKTKKRIEEELTKKYDANKVIVNNRVDKSIIGGLRIKFGDTLIDGSVETFLNVFRSRAS